MDIIRKCPVCGGNVILTYEVEYGHGESGFNGKSTCQGCGLSGGKVSDYGSPAPYHKDKSFKEYCEFVSKFKLNG